MQYTPICHFWSITNLLSASRSTFQNFDISNTQPVLFNWEPYKNNSISYIFKHLSLVKWKMLGNFREKRQNWIILYCSQLNWDTTGEVELLVCRNSSGTNKKHLKVIVFSWIYLVWPFSLLYEHYLLIILLRVCVLFFVLGSIGTFCHKIV